MRCCSSEACPIALNKQPEIPTDPMVRIPDESPIANICISNIFNMPSSTPRNPKEANT